MSPGPLVILGPTASGKSALAMELARRRPGVELLSADSMQVYVGMDIGTAKPTAAEQAEVPHHLIDLVEPSVDYGLARFQDAALAALEEIRTRGATPVLVGGTGLYIRAVVDRLEIPGRYPDARSELDAQPDTDALHRELRELDPVAAERMEPTNRRRIVRALEVTLGSGRPFSSFGPGLETYPETCFTQIGIDLPRAVLDVRIADRYEQQRAAGFVDEAAALLGRPGGVGSTARQALGYRELFDHLEGDTTLDQAFEEAVRRTRRFARRQQRWFRRDPRVRWLDAATNPMDLLDEVLGVFDSCN